jgi:hypothetical protein
MVLFFLSTTPFWGGVYRPELVFKTQVMAKGFKTRVSEF